MIFTRQKILLLVLLVISIAGCVSEARISNLKKTISKHSDWNDEFPKSKYLTATATGATESMAKRAALAELSSIFESKVMSETTSMVNSYTDKKDNEVVTKKAAQHIRVLSSVQLKGAEIGQTVYDENQKTYYAIAVLERNQARKNWHAEGEAINKQIESLLENLNLQKSDFSKLQLLKKVKKNWIAQEVISSRLRVLGFSSAKNQNYNIREVFDEISRIKATLTLYIYAGGGKYGKHAADEIAKNLGKAGFAMTTIKVNANVFISGEVTVNPVEMKNKKFKFARAKASLAIIDSQTGFTVGEISENKRTGHNVYSEAAEKAIKKVSEKVSAQVMAYFE